MYDKEFITCKLKLGFPKGRITCDACIFCAKSLVTATHCSVTGAVIPKGENGRLSSCPLELISE